MSEQITEKKEESQKTVIAFIVGLIIGGLLIWAFTGGETDNKKVTEKSNGADKTEVGIDVGEQNINDNDDVATSSTGTSEESTLEGSAAGAAVVKNQTAGRHVDLESATFPTAEGWVGVRDYNDGEMGFILGVARYSQSQGLVPEQIILQRPTVANREYAIVFFTEDGDRQFNPARDVQVGDKVTTFKAE